MGPRTSGKSWSKKQLRGSNPGMAQVVENPPSQKSNNINNKCSAFYNQCFIQLPDVYQAR